MDELANDQVAPTSSRRAVLIGAIGGIGAWAAAALGRAAPAKAADGQTVLLGDSPTSVANNQHLIYTKITNAQHPGSNVYFASPGGYGVLAYNDTQSAAAWGISTGEGGQGVKGEGTIGVLGISPQVGVNGYTESGTGVLGQATSGYAVKGVATTGRGVFGQAASGLGVRGYATSGVGLSGEATTGHALRTAGRVRFDKVSGIATLAAGALTNLISPGIDVTADSFVLLTAGVDIGTRRLWFTKDTTANTITIHMSSSRTSATSVSWLLLR